MKQLFIAVALFATINANAQSEKYAGAMGKALEAMGAAKTSDDFRAASATFERIGDAEKNQWLPYYYAGICLTTMAWADNSIDKDANSAKVLALCDKADAITSDSSDKSEILSVRNMAYSQQMLVDPPARWMTYGQQANKALQQAMALNPNNGRLYYLQGMSVFGTPEQFGGGKAKAKPLFEKAFELLSAEQAKPLYPHWGKEQAEGMIKQCGE